MTIRNAHSYLEGVWDWGILKGCFGDTKIEPTDIDGLVERRGHFLILETKKVDVPVGFGQWKTFNAFIDTGYFMVIILWGSQNNPIEMQILYPKPYKPSNKRSCTLEDVRKVVRWWFTYANSK